MYRYYRKWLRDSRGGKGNPDWDGDQVLLPWRLYFCYGDTAILRENFDAMKNIRGYSGEPDSRLHLS